MEATYKGYRLYVDRKYDCCILERPSDGLLLIDGPMSEVAGTVRECVAWLKEQIDDEDGLRRRTADAEAL